MDKTHIGPFANERSMTFTVLKAILDAHDIPYEIEGKNYSYYEGSMELGITLVIRQQDA